MLDLWDSRHINGYVVLSLFPLNINCLGRGFILAEFQTMEDCSTCLWLKHRLFVVLNERESCSLGPFYFSLCSSQWQYQTYGHFTLWDVSCHCCNRISLPITLARLGALIPLSLALVFRGRLELTLWQSKRSPGRSFTGLQAKVRVQIEVPRSWLYGGNDQLDTDYKLLFWDSYNCTYSCNK